MLDPLPGTATVRDLARFNNAKHDTIDGGDVLPGFSLPVAPLFANPDG